MKAFKKINSWNNTTLYQATNGIKTVNVEVDNIKDKIGCLKRVECSVTGFFEVYGMNEVKERVFNALNS